jgi:hypothetical protein
MANRHWQLADTELTPEERERMKVLLREFWGSWITWVVLIGMVVTIATLVTVGVYFQRADYQHKLDVSESRTIEAIATRQEKMIKAITDLKAKTNHNAEIIKPLTGLSKAIETVKDAVKEVKP